MIKMLYDIFLMNEEEMIADYKEITAGRKSQPISKTCTIVGDTERNGMPLIFIEEGASVEGAFLNTNSGPIYIGKDAIIMEGACIRNALPHASTLKLIWVLKYTVQQLSARTAKLAVN